MTAALAVEALTVRYGGRTAVADVSFVASAGEVVGLIGPNGAGKTSVLNACTGLVRPTAGLVLLHGSEVSSLSPASRARRGLGRTFQRPALFASLSVLDNVMLGWEANQARTNPLGHLWASRRTRLVGESRTAEALQQCRIERIAGRRATELTSAERKRVELARVIAGGFTVLLLDEPSSGLDQSAKESFSVLLRELVESRKLTAVVVEHDMDLVASVCDEVVVLDSGRVLHTGPPEQVRNSDAVNRTYLGDGGA